MNSNVPRFPVLDIALKLLARWPADRPYVATNTHFRWRILCVIMSFCVGLLANPTLADEDAAVASSVCATAPQMAWIPRTQLKIGSPIEGDTAFAYRACEKPEHVVDVPGFYLGRFLVTAEEFCVFLNDVDTSGYFLIRPMLTDWRTIRKTGDRYVPQAGAERCPAYPVTWVGANAYCEWLSRRVGRPYRLPTEAEWEAAARGPEGRLWPWGDEPPILENHLDVRTIVTDEYLRKLAAEFIERLDAGTLPEQESAEEVSTSGFPTRRNVITFEPSPFYNLRGLRWMRVPFDKGRPWIKAPVGSFPLNATPQGVYDMLGYYTGEWCADCFDPNRYMEPPNGSTIGSTANVDMKCQLRAVRGLSQMTVTAKPTIANLLWLPALLVGGDTGPPDTTPGRVWSREGMDPRTAGAAFRVAMDGPANGSQRGGHRTGSGTDGGHESGRPE